MAHVHIEINTDNAAFDDCNKQHEIARILRGLADKIETSSSVCTLRDINGNKVGEYNDYPDANDNF